MVSDIRKYWGQVFYNWFYNISKALGFNTFFCCLGMIVRQYKHLRILVIFQTFNNIIAHRLLTTCCGVLSDHYCYKTTNNFEKLLEQKDAKNTLKLATPILLTICMHIGPTRLLEVSLSNTEYDLERKLYEGCINANWVDDGEIEEAMAADHNKDNDKKDF